MTPPADDPGALSPLRRAYLALDEMQAKVARLEGARTEALAVIGLGCRFPGGAVDPAAFWRLLRDGVDAVTEVPRERWDVDAYYDPDVTATGRTATRWGAFIEHVDRFDAAFFGISPREAIAMDPQHRLLLEVTWEALENAGQPPDRLGGSRTGVYVGIASGDYAQRLLSGADPGRLDAYYASGNAHSMAAGRLSYILGLQGPSLTVDTACSSSLVAVHLACQSLRSGECRLAVAGGVHLTLSPENTIAFSRARMLAADGRCKTFDAAADGFTEGEGCGVVVLKRLSDAIADGDRVLAVVRGSAVNQDGPSAGLTAPSGPAQEAVIREALANGGVAPEDVAYVEAHGTGTSLGDPIEIRAIASVLAARRTPERRLLVGSVKTNIGHLEAAAGVAGLIKVILALQHDQIPAHLHFRTPNPHVDWRELAIDVVAAARPWPAGPRLAGVSSFGFSGTNAHLIVGAAAPAAAPAAPARPAHVLTLSAKTRAALAELAGRYASSLDQAGAELADVCFTAGTGRAQLEHRLAIVASSAEEARARLRSLAADEVSPRVIRGHVPSSARRPRVAFLFPGQGAQYAGMGRDLYAGHAAFRAAVERVAAALEPAEATRLRAAVTGEGAGEVDETATAQVALFAVEWALAEVWRGWGVRPAVVVGHSVGEYAAACVAGVMEVETAARLVAARGRLMGALPEGGAMVAVRAAPAVVQGALEAGRAAGAVGLAAVNGPESVVVSGAAAAVAAVVARLAATGVRGQALRVSHAFHSELMAPMQRAFRAEAGRPTWGAPHVTWVSTVTGRPLGVEEIGADYWVRQVREPVRFAAAMEAVGALGVDASVEVGPGTTLLGLGRGCLEGGPERLWVASLRPGREDWEQVLESVAKLWAVGADVDWAAFDREQPRQRVTLPTYPWQRESYWLPSALAAPTHARGTASDRAATPVVHPLVARRLSSPLPGAQFEVELSATAPGFLAQHRIDGAVVVPATAHLEMIGTAAILAGVGAAHCIEDITLQEALVIPDGETRTIQVVLTPVAPDSMTAQVWSLISAGEGRFTLHVEGRVRPGDAPAPTVTIAEARRRCTDTLSDVDFYARLDGRGLELGPAFRGVRRVDRIDGEALARIELPAEVADDARYRIHPLLLDACIQAIAAAVPEAAVADHLFVPMALDRFRVVGGAGRHAWSHVRITSPLVGETLTADLQVLDEAGGLVGELLGLRLKRAPRCATRRPAAIAEWLHEIAWVPAPLAAGPRGVGDTAARLTTEVARWTADSDLARYDAAMRVLDRVSVGYIVGALRSLGCDLRPRRAVRREDLAARLGVIPRYRRLLDRWLEILVEDGLLRTTDEGWVPVRDGADPGIEALLGSLGDHESAAAAEAAFLLRCGPRLAEVVHGTCDPLALLFPGGSPDVAERLYHESPPARVSGALVREAVQAALARLPASRPVRVLEIGGGTGGTTAAVLPVLPAERSEYLFTDISGAFTARARERFAAYPFLRARPLDIEAEPTPDELAGAPFDMIVAANVLHATADLRRTLEHCRRRLAPGGVLILVEVTVPQRWVDLTFGLTEGWWRFSDDALRPRYPLLTQARWVSLLEDAGFSEVVAAPDPAAVRGTLAQQSVIVSVRRETTADPAPGDARPWIVLADRGGVGDRLAEQLRGRGMPCAVVRASLGAPGDADGAEATDTAAVRRALAPAGREPRGVVSLWALDAGDESGAGMERSGPLTAALGALHAVQALIDGARAGRRLWLVSRGAQRLGPDASPPACAQAPVWGIGRTVRREHPEIRCVCLDLDPSPAVDPVPALLAEMLAAAEGEDEIAWRGGQRLAARLGRWVDRRPAPTRMVERLERSQPASLEGLTFRSGARRGPGPGEVEIAVRAAALNFKDVLNALDMYPGEAGPLGSECAGTIVAVGAGVDSLRAGDHVVAIAAGCLATFVTARAALVAPKPVGLTFEQAASLPVAYITGAHALLAVGGLQRGERVLVHAAAGGVGLAAVRLAQRRGAEVLATAGSIEKREFLRAQGVAHVFDSRSVEFRDEVLRATHGRGVDLVLNSLSGDAIGASVAALAHDGRFLEIGKRGIWTEEEMRSARPDVRYTVIDWSGLALSSPDLVRRHLTEILDSVEAGDLPVPPVTVFPFAEAVSAFRHMAQARHQGKIVLSASAHAALETTPAIRADATYLVTGGLGGLGLEVARWLVTQGARSLVLAGRHAPSAASSASVAGLVQAGAQVAVVRADVSDRAQVERLLGRGLARPPLRGIIHAAGVLDDRLLAQQDAGTLARVMAAKVEGTRNLADATAGQPLDFFVLFSSIAGILGSPGQANHAAANAYLDAFAHHRRARGLPALAIDWGAWADVGAVVEHDAARRLAGQGIGRMRSDDGLAALEAVMAGAAVQVAVAPMEWATLLSRLPGRPPSLLRDVARRAQAAGPAPTAPIHAERNLPADLAAAAPAKRHAMLRDHIAERTRRILGLDAGQSVDPLRPLKELGVDSLMAVEIRNVLKSDLGLDGGLPATLVFDYPTVDGIAHYLAREVLGLETPPRTGAAGAAAPTVLSRVEDLSDDEVDRLLGERLESAGS